MDEANSWTMARAVRATKESIALEMQKEDEPVTMSSETCSILTAYRASRRRLANRLSQRIDDDLDVEQIKEILQTCCTYPPPPDDSSLFPKSSSSLTSAPPLAPPEASASVKQWRKHLKMVLNCKWKEFQPQTNPSHVERSSFDEMFSAITRVLQRQKHAVPQKNDDENKNNDNRKRRSCGTSHCHARNVESKDTVATTALRRSSRSVEDFGGGGSDSSVTHAQRHGPDARGRKSSPACEPPLPTARKMLAISHLRDSSSSSPKSVPQEEQQQQQQGRVQPGTIFKPPQKQRHPRSGRLCDGSRQAVQRKENQKNASAMTIAMTKTHGRRSLAGAKRKQREDKENEVYHSNVLVQKTKKAKPSGIMIETPQNVRNNSKTAKTHMRFAVSSKRSSAVGKSVAVINHRNKKHRKFGELVAKLPATPQDPNNPHRSSAFANTGMTKERMPQTMALTRKEKKIDKEEEYKTHGRRSLAGAKRNQREDKENEVYHSNVLVQKTKKAKPSGIMIETPQNVRNNSKTANAHKRFAVSSKRPSAVGKSVAVINHRNKKHRKFGELVAKLPATPQDPNNPHSSSAFANTGMTKERMPQTMALTRKEKKIDKEEEYNKAEQCSRAPCAAGSMASTRTKQVLSVTTDTTRTVAQAPVPASTKCHSASDYIRKWTTLRKTPAAATGTGPTPVATNPAVGKCSQSSRISFQEDNDDVEYPQSAPMMTLEEELGRHHRNIQRPGIHRGVGFGEIRSSIQLPHQSKRGPARFISQGPPTEHLKGGWPPGWIQVIMERQSGKTEGRWDRYWYSPLCRYRFRSMVMVKQFLSFLERTKGNEPMAIQMFPSQRPKC